MAVPGDTGVPRWLSTAAALSWRLLVSVGALLVLGLAFTRLEVIAVPVIAALFVATILGPPVEWLRGHGWPSLLATFCLFLLTLGIIVGVVFGLYPTVSSEFVQLGSELTAGLGRLQNWLVTGPLGLSRAQVDQYVGQIEQLVTTNRSEVVKGALSGVTVALQIVGGLLLSVVLSFFFVKDSGKLSAWAVGLGGTPARSAQLRDIGRDLWATLTGYVRGTALNGLVNAVLLGLSLVILQVPLVLPIVLLTFVGGFLPLVGAIVSGILAALVALVAKGPIAAAIIIGATVVVHNVEGYLTGPLILRRAVNLHPVAILLALAVGSILGGIVGAFVAVPLTAVVVVLASHRRRNDLLIGPDVASSDLPGTPAGAVLNVFVPDAGHGARRPGPAPASGDVGARVPSAPEGVLLEPGHERPDVTGDAGYPATGAGAGVAGGRSRDRPGQGAVRPGGPSERDGR